MVLAMDRMRAKQQVGKRQREERFDFADRVGVNFRTGCGLGECDVGYGHWDDYPPRFALRG
jgi:hypothetical protein